MDIRHDQDTGRLILTLEDGDKETLENMIERATNLDHGVLADIMDTFGFSGNGRFHAVMPENVPGALTDSPFIADDVDIKDDGTVEVIGKAWWFPNYQITSFAEELLGNGKTEFVFAGDFSPAPVRRAKP